MYACEKRNELLIRQLAVRGLYTFHCECLSTGFGNGWGCCIWMLSLSCCILKWFDELNFYDLTEEEQFPRHPACMKYSMLNGGKMKWMSCTWTAVHGKHIIRWYFECGQTNKYSLYWSKQLYDLTAKEKASLQRHSKRSEMVNTPCMRSLWSYVTFMVAKAPQLFLPTPKMSVETLYFRYHLGSFWHLHKVVLPSVTMSVTNQQNIWSELCIKLRQSQILFYSFFSINWNLKKSVSPAPYYF